MFDSHSDPFFTVTPPKQNRRPEPRKHTKDPPLAILVFLNFFGSMRLFPKIFDRTKGSPYIRSDILQQCMLINPKGSLFHIFRLYETVQNYHFSFFFRKFFCWKKVVSEFYRA